MKARLSIYNQVVEVFEDVKYNIDEVYPNETIVECPDSVTPLMWYIDGQWLQEYTIPVVQVYDDTVDGLTIDQVADMFRWRGFI